MDVVIHRIRLRPGIEPHRFETWVREVDYVTCPQLPSVQTFSVQRTGRVGNYFEVITVSDRAAFEQDMQLPAFRSLVEGFAELAEVVDEFEGTRIDPGYGTT